MVFSLHPSPSLTLNQLHCTCCTSHDVHVIPLTHYISYNHTYLQYFELLARRLGIHFQICFGFNYIFFIFCIDCLPVNICFPSCVFTFVMPGLKFLPPPPPLLPVETYCVQIYRFFLSLHSGIHCTFVE